MLQKKGWNHAAVSSLTTSKISFMVELKWSKCASALTFLQQSAESHVILITFSNRKQLGWKLLRLGWIKVCPCGGTPYPTKSCKKGWRIGHLATFSRSIVHILIDKTTRHKNVFVQLMENHKVILKFLTNWLSNCDISDSYTRQPQRQHNGSSQKYRIQNCAVSFIYKLQ